ncbi:MAG: hypothetical protein J0M24_18190 [Verrucomicrobia bacterium]|nr:hypothetical protein [Verrucomicrobiota bacterium]
MVQGQGVAPVKEPERVIESASVTVEQGADFRVVEWVTATTDESGEKLSITNRYTEMATGLHYRDEQGQWQETVAEFVAVPDGFVAARGPHQVALSTELTVPGAVTVVTADGQTLRSSPALLAFTDRVSGESVLLAEVQPSRAEQIEPGTVLYANVLDSVPADLRTVYTAAGFECDLILREPLPDPAHYGLNPDTTDVEVYTEFFGSQPTAVEVREVPVGERESAADAQLTFGPMVMDRGRAFVLPGERDSREVPVRKSWEQREGREFLIERTAYRDLEPLLRELPEASAPPAPNRQRSRNVQRTAQLSIPSRVGVTPRWRRTEAGRLVAMNATSSPRPGVAKNQPSVPGVVLDYTLVNSSTNQTFGSLTTYYVSGLVNLSSSVTFQAGTVIKYAKTNSPSLKVLAGTAVTWLGAPYRPVVLTGYDDNSVGELLPASTGSPAGTYATKALELDGTGRTSPLILTNLSIRHADVGVAATYFSAANSILTLRHGQFVHCNGAFRFQLGFTGSSTYEVQNCLVYSTNSGSAAWRDLYYAKVSAEFLTLNAVGSLRQSLYSPDYSTVSLENSLIYNVANTNGVSLFKTAAPPVNPFVAVGSGAHYLNVADGVVFNYVGADWTLTSPSLGADLDASTVKPPVALPSSLSVNWSLPYPPANLQGEFCDFADGVIGFQTFVGYHYWPIHYFVSSVVVTNSTLSLVNSKILTKKPLVLAGHGSSGLQMASGSQFLSLGQAQALNRLCWSSAVQELPTGGAPAGNRSFFSIPSGSSVWPQLDLRFSQAEFDGAPYTRRGLFEMSASGKNLAAATLRDSQFRGAWIDFAPVNYGTQTLILKNCVFEDSRIGVYKYYSGNPTIKVQNCLIQSGAFTLYHYYSDSGTPPWTCTDNFFATSGVSAYSTATNRLYAGWNGYTTSSPVFGGNGNKISVALDWLPGPLGAWYYPTNGSTNGLFKLLSAGTQSATNVGLYHYTTRVDQSKEGTNRIDIGFHYVATTNLVALDSDNDGIPDVTEDANGNGTIEGTESAWNSHDSDSDGLWDPDELRYALSGPLSNSDSDGILDKFELFQGTNPLDPTNSLPKLLGDWRFNTTGVLTNEQGLSPLNGASIPLVASYADFAPSFGTTVALTNVLRYPLSIGTNPVLNLMWGTINFTYVPDWYFGNATNQPGQWCRLIECGAWQLSISPDGQYIVFESPAADGTATRNFTGRLPRTHSPTISRTGWEITLEWCRAYCRLNINQVQLLDENSKSFLGVGVMALPSAASIAGGFTLGSAVDGSAGARGYLDQLTSYNAVLYQSFLNNFTSTETLFNRVAHPVERRKVELTATPVSGPEGLELRWNRGWEGDPAANAGKYTLEKRLVGVTNWSILRTNVFADSWRDTNAEPGKYYEYRVVRSPEELSPTITASLRGAAMESRGTAILLIDQTLATDLASQIDTFKLDLVADGWKVVSTLAHRHTNFSSAGVPDANYLANLQSNKGFIRTQWQANPNGTNVVILLGHVTVPYSGNTAEDGHTENSGSWSADLWYGDMDNDTNWTDSITGGAGFQQNRPLDGKWDNDFLPGNGRLEIPVGRIDFYNLPSFEGKPLANYTNSLELVERELLKNYLSKSSLYRQGRLGAFLKSSTAFSYDLRFISVFESQSRVSNWLMGQFTPASETTTDLFVKTNPVRLVGFHGGNGSFCLNMSLCG